MTTSAGELKYSTLTRIASEDELYAARVNALAELLTCDILDNGGSDKVLNLALANTAYELKVGASVKAARKLVEFRLLDNNIFFGYSSAVTPSTGCKLFKNEHLIRSIGPNTSIWFVSSVADVNVWIAEL
jgi:hypothetical protein